MTTATIWRVTCDAPRCSAMTVVDKLDQLPDDWTTVSSTAHLDGWEPGRRRKSEVTKRWRTDPRSRLDVLSGEFWLHLCPAHPGAFAEHQPSTEGSATDRRGSRRVNVRCSCGWAGGWVDAAILLRNPGDPAPARFPERAWWKHLPANLQAYAGRGREVPS